MSAIVSQITAGVSSPPFSYNSKLYVGNVLKQTTTVDLFMLDIIYLDVGNCRYLTMLAYQYYIFRRLISRTPYHV